MIPNQQLLINVCLPRVRQLGLGHRRWSKPLRARPSLTSRSEKSSLANLPTSFAPRKPAPDAAALNLATLSERDHATETILNRKGAPRFHILERYEAGIELKAARYNRSAPAKQI